MKKIVQGIGWLMAAVAGIVLLYSLAFGMTWIGIEWRGFFGPKRAIVERNIYEESPSFVQGKILDLSRYHHQWRKAEPDEREALEALIRQQMVQLDPDSIRDEELRRFYVSIR